MSITSEQLSNSIVDYIESDRRDCLVLKGVPKHLAVDWAKQIAEWISTLTVESGEPIEVGVCDDGTGIQLRKAGRVQ